MPLDMFDYIAISLIPLYIVVEWLDYKREQSKK